jgi:bifunctional DNA-binding transcriptional regulator/antitoxin component of YhaV-PrlF toxin-antitoxin module
MANLTVELAQRGQVTIPKALRDEHRWDTGQQFTIIDLDGVIIMSPTESKVDVLADQLRDDLLNDGATLEDMLAELRQIREADGRMLK